MPHAPFVHLRVRSQFSLLEGAVRHDELAARCQALAIPAVAVTDRANLFGAMQFSEAMKRAGVQPILGTLLPLATEPPRARAAGGGSRAAPALVPLLVQNEAGYRNLLKLMSRAYLGAGEPVDGVEVGLEALCAHAEGLICLSGGATGPIGAALAQGDRARAAASFAALHAAFGDRFYQEISRHGLEAESAVEDALLELAYAAGVPLVATNDVHFLDEDFYEAHDVLLCIASGAQVSQEERRRLTPEHRLKTPAEMAMLFADLPEAVANTLVIAQRCAFMAPARAPILPTFAVDEAAEMRREAAAGLERRLADTVWTAGMDAAAREAAAAPYRERLAFECDVIVAMNFPGYFLIVSDFIRWAKRQGIPVGPGRGSGAGSLVAWSLEITDLDPLRFGLLFERFLNPDRVSMPDFDIDFCEERRGEVIAYVRERYGADRVAQIITFGTLQARAALRDCGRVMGLPFGLVDKICKMVPANPANPVTLARAIEIEPRLRQAMGEDLAVGRMVQIALKLEGLPRNASTHAAGVVIGDRPLDELVPLYRDPRAPMPATQFNMKDVEKAGLVKFDFLGLSTLTLLAMAERMVNARGTQLRLATIPLADGPTFALLGRAETTGVFQLESGGMRDALRQLKPDMFEDIIAMVSLYRPGPMDNIPRYIAVKHGREDPSYLHPALEPILKETNGVIIYQEQVMEIAKQLAGYTLGGADLLRRAMGKKIKAEMDAQRETFVAGCRSGGIDGRLADTIFDAVAKFASYGFNKSHAAAYALLAWQTAYLKANHAPEFYAAAMTIEMANKEKLAGFRQEMAARGLLCLPPDVNRSAVRFEVEDTPNGPAVRFALAAIKGVGAAAMEMLVAERARGGPFADIFELTRRVGARHVNKRLLEALVKAGALDSVDPNRRRLLEAVEPALRWAQAAAEAAASGQASLFGGAGALPDRPPLPPVEDWPALERLQQELEVIGFYMSAHPLDGHAAILRRLNVTMIADLPERLAELHGRGRLLMAGIVLGKQERITERARFAFAQLSDPTGSFEIMLFDAVLAASRELLEAKAPLLVHVDGRLEDGMPRLNALRVEPLDQRVERAGGLVEIRLADLASAQRLKELLAASGGARVRLAIPRPDGRDLVVALPDAFLLRYDRRMDVERQAGVLALRELAL